VWHTDEESYTTNWAMSVSSFEKKRTSGRDCTFFLSSPIPHDGGGKVAPSGPSFCASAAGGRLAAGRRDEEWRAAGAMHAITYACCSADRFLFSASLLVGE
jgi:hypothetical protein